ncbi:hypothetical protein [Microcoleus sp. CAWBG58]|uniref:hypothetical protein n=1 Tax=Microcoleus sp. CAWBG58 TaxID=2841651 RepID=UPI0025DD4900|nr:hypothetical protein [Microcoleus sp. CAWBG58]
MLLLRKYSVCCIYFSKELRQNQVFLLLFCDRAIAKYSYFLANTAWESSRRKTI